MRPPFHQKKRILFLTQNKIVSIVAMFIIAFFTIFIFVGIFTSLHPNYRVSSNVIQKWTTDIDETLFLSLFSMENRAFSHALPEDEPPINMWQSVFELGTNIRLHDVRSLLGREIPGFDTYDRQILIAGEGTDYTNLTMESTPPLDIVLEEREATEPEEKQDREDSQQSEQTTGERDVVFIYNTHNRESFLPYLPEAEEPNDAFHDEVNITRVSQQLSEDLKRYGIGSKVDDTDIGSILVENDWNYSTHSYQASKEVVETALQEDQHLNYVFDLHRDSMRMDVTTKEIDGKNYAKLMFVIGGDNPHYEKNYALAKSLHEALEKEYPGISRGVEKYGGAGRDGVYNQDVSENALTIEFGGVDNTMEELYNTSEVLAEIFSEYYWNAEKVSGEE
ncbi:stage II sporulation protein P [Gracilibacillus halophilus YIM-C55.5]|uniref:Stage II sporulation protein P n=1 Tax=Gracilibacillus halophilus YIM-C55.5 TaxID=1308866 RepID=N4WT58_9BACI|nr:stage II sporulation protein P [Gracilibacillus halophilus]ENH97525.1 stage II sporulation protein P [Gracilibacillus halophilus YIM-C55.5]